MPRKTNFKVNGSEYFRVTATIGTKPDGTPLRKQFYGNSKKEAEAKRDEYITGIKQGLPVDFDKAIFRHVFETWFENVLKPSVSLTSYIRYEKDYRLRIRDSDLAGLRLVDIKPLHVQSHYNYLLSKCSVNAVRLVHKLLGNFFNYCVKSDLIIKSPLTAVELPQNRKQTETNTAVSDDDITKIVQAAKSDISDFIFAFALFTGLRQGEILALRHKDVDWENNVIHVNKTMKYLTVDGAYQPVLSETKTQSSIRDVPILSNIHGLLRQHIVAEKEKHFKVTIPFSSDSILFSSSNCTYRESSNVRRALSRMCRRIGIEDTTFHSLRHTFCTILAKQGVPLKTASTLMGHSNIAITAAIYTHVDNAELKKGVERLSVYFG
jgi:integrase